MASWRQRLALALAPHEVRALTANDAIRGLWAGVQTSTGLHVDEKTSLQVIAVFNAIKILSEGFAQIPLKVYRRKGDGREEARGHPMYSLLHDAPNERMTAMNMREHWMTALGLWGNSCTQIIRNNRGEIESLWPLHPAYVKKERLPDKRIIYRVSINSDPSGYVASQEQKVLRDDEVLHIMGLSLDGFWGLSPIQMIRENIGLADAYTQFAGKFFANDAMDFALFTDRVMQQPQLDEMHKEWTDKHGGLNKHRLAIFHGGLKPEKIGMPLDDAQFIEQRAFSREEIFSVYRIPPNFYAADKVSSWGTGIEQMQTGFIKFTMDPWFVRAEQTLNLKFLSSNAQGPLFAEFDREGFLRGDFSTRIEGYTKLFNMAVISNVGIARLENLPEPPEEVFMVPSNLSPVDKVDAIADKAAAPAPVPVQAPAQDNVAARMALITAQRPVLIDVVDRIIRRASFDIEKQREKRSAEDFDAWLAQFRVEHETFAEKHLRSILESFSEAICADVSRETGLHVPPLLNFTPLIIRQFAKVVAEAEGIDVVDAKLVSLGNELSEAAYTAAGATMQTVTRGDFDVLISRVDGPSYERGERHLVPAAVSVSPAPAMPVIPNVTVYTNPSEELLRQLEVAKENEVKPEDVEAIGKAAGQAAAASMAEFLRSIVLQRDMAPTPQPPIHIELVFPKDAIRVEVAPGITKIEPGAVQVTNNVPTQGQSAGFDIKYDNQGRMTGTRRIPGDASN